MADSLGTADPAYLDGLLKTAGAKYPFIHQYSPMLSLGEGQDDYAETWPVGETGDPKSPRPAHIPMDRVGVQIFKPQHFGPDDLAAEFLHVDPFANGTREQLLKSFTPQQVATLTKASGDYKQSVDMGLPEEKAMSNATDSAMRGYTVGQWPAEANAQMNYSPAQKRMLDSLQQYMTSGIYPSTFDLGSTK